MLCEISDSLTTDTFSIRGEKNKNDCDESGDGNNNPDCEIDSTKDIGPINIVAP